MGLFDKIKEPVFLKETSNASVQVAQLQALLAKAPPDLKGKIEQDIKTLTAGIHGEETIAFELKNCHLPMLILHDLYLEYGDLSAQIDYMIVTRKRTFIVECKNLYGDIEINSSGDFIRTIHYSGKHYKEGIYSPITQNKRHLELLRQLRREAKGNLITKAIFDRHFYDNYRSVVVLANARTVLNARDAQPEVKQQVIRADQLISFITKVNAEPGAEPMSEQQMEKLAQFYLDLHKENPTDYTAKYQLPEEPAQVICPKCGAPMVKRQATKGVNAGKSFYGCSRFPKCRGVIDITE